MPDKPSKVQKKIHDLQGQNAILLGRFIRSLEGSKIFEPRGTEKNDEKAGRAIFQDVQRSVVTGYSRPGSTSVTGPFDFFNKYLDRGDEGGGEDVKKKKAEPAWWKKFIGPALMILGGIAAFVMGIMTDGPLKGFFKLLSEGGIMGGLRWLGNVVSKVFETALKGLKAVFGSKAITDILGKGGQIVTKIFLPVKRFFISTLPKFIGKLVGPITKIVGIAGKDITKFLAKAASFVLKNLKFIPFLGGLISFGFAYSRFKSGDIIGGTIDLVSGILGMVPPGPWSFVTIPLSIGLSVLNAVLDAKAGGATGKQTGAKADMLKRWAGKLFGMIALLPPFSNVYHLAQGIVQGVQGNWKAAANHFMYSVPVVGDILRWLDVGFKDPSGEPIKGDKQSFFKKAIDWAIKIPPLSNLFALFKAIQAIFKGEWSEAGRQFMFSIPGIGDLLKWVIGDSVNLEQEKVEGSKQGFWSKLFGWVTKIPPISNVIHLAKGISNIFKGNFVTAGKHMMRSIPLIGNLISWFGGEVGAPEDNEPMGSNKGFFTSIKDAFYVKFKAVWKKLPRWAKWAAKRLPFLGGILKKLDEPEAATESVTGQVERAITDGYKDVKAVGDGVWNGVGDKIKDFGSESTGWWGKIKGAGSSLWEGTKNFFSNSWDASKKGWSKIGEVAGNLWGSTKEFFGNQWEKAKERWNGIKDAASNLWGSTKEFFGNQWEKAKERWSSIKGAASNLWGGIKNRFSKLSETATKAWSGVKSAMSSAWNNVKSGANWLKDKATSAWSGINSAASGAWTSIKGGLSSLWDSAKGIGKKILDKVGLGDDAPAASPLLTISKSQLSWLGTMGRRLYKVWQSVVQIAKSVSSSTTQTPAVNAAATIARHHLVVADRMSHNIQQILSILETAVFPDAQHRGRLIGATKAAQIQREMSVEQDTSNLHESVKIQKDMLTELREGSIYRAIVEMNTNVSGKLDTIAENVGGKQGILGVMGGSGGAKQAPAQSPGRFDRMGNRQWQP